MKSQVKKLDFSLKLWYNDIIKRKEEKNMSEKERRESILTYAVAHYGVEHPYVISIARMIESNVSTETIIATLRGLLMMEAL